ncbi:hypothetical protein MRX96_049108 [Rhipicephalus microplus]
MPVTSSPANGTCYSNPTFPTVTNLLKQRHKGPRKTETTPIPGQLRRSVCNGHLVNRDAEHPRETPSIRAKPHRDSAPSLTLPATPPVNMEVTVEGNNISVKSSRPAI